MRDEEKTSALHGLLVRFARRERTSWIGVFSFGSTLSGTTGIYTHPDERCLCIVARGKGYLVQSADPSCCEEVAIEPILDVRPVPPRGLLVFADFDHLVAYDRTGLVWRTGRLAIDDLHITAITQDHIHGNGYAGYDGEPGYDFMVDLQTGQHEGGVPWPFAPPSS